MTRETAERVKGFLGLCTRAGQAVFGQDACVDAVRRRAAAVVLLEEDCSGNTRKRLMDACRTHETPLYGLEANMIARATGKDGRKVVILKPGSMGKKMLALLKDEPPLGSANAQDQENQG